MWEDVLPSHSVEVVESGARMIYERKGCVRMYYLHTQ